MSTPITATLIKTFREQQGLTLKELGELALVAESNVCHYEKGRRIPAACVAWRLARALKLSRFSAQTLIYFSRASEKEFEYYMEAL